MATHRDYMFGTTPCRIDVEKHVDPLLADLPSVARAFCNDEEVTEDDQPVELAASTDEGAIERMCRYLEGRFGSRSGDVL